MVDASLVPTSDGAVVDTDTGTMSTDAHATNDATLGVCGPGMILCTDCDGGTTCSVSPVCPPLSCAMSRPVTCSPGSSLSCYVNKNCDGGAQTTLRGKVYDPAGKVPLPNVVVWIPDDPNALPAITPGTSTCNACDVSVGGYVTATTSASDGSFMLQGVPTVGALPLVIQTGKWRRVITVPAITDCGMTVVPDTGTGQARLPRNQHEGDMPQMALLTGGEDDLGCFLARVGIDPAEYGSPHNAGGTGRLDVYQGFALTGSAPGLSNGSPGNCTNTSCPLWDSTKSLENYDVVLLACEGATFDKDAADSGVLMGNRTNVTSTAKQAMHDWLGEGGKLFATHFQYTWFQNGPSDFQGVANWLGASAGNGACANCLIDTSFEKGQQLHDWLQNVSALDSDGGISLNNVANSVSSVNAPTARWIYGGTGSADGGTNTKYLSFDTPIGGIPSADGGSQNPQYCGRAVFSDVHAGGMPSGAVPSSCRMVDLSAEEKALEFLLFDLSACVQTEPGVVLSPPPNP